METPELEDRVGVSLPYREPQLGKDYWVEDNVLPNALEVAQRCISNSTWTLGSPWRSEPWPGMRAPNALTVEELNCVEACVKKGLGIKSLKPQSHTEMGISGHNHIQIVGGAEGRRGSGPRGAQRGPGHRWRQQPETAFPQGSVAPQARAGSDPRRGREEWDKHSPPGAVFRHERGGRSQPRSL